MAALWITIDHIDGRTTVKGPMYPDEINLSGMLFRLAEQGIAGITFTTTDPLNLRAMAKAKGSDPVLVPGSIQGKTGAS